MFLKDSLKEEIRPKRGPSKLNWIFPSSNSVILKSVVLEELLALDIISFKFHDFGKVTSSHF